MSRNDPHVQAAWLDWLPLAGLIALGGVLALSTTPIATAEWQGVGVWAAVLLVAVLLPGASPQARGLAAAALILFAVLKSLDPAQLEEWWIRDVYDPRAPVEWSRLGQGVPLVTWVVLFLLLVGLLRVVVRRRQLGTVLNGVALGGTVLLLLAALTPAALLAAPSSPMGGSLPFAVGAGWLMAHGVLPLPALAGACEDAARSRWLGGGALLVWAAKAVMAFVVTAPV